MASEKVKFKDREIEVRTFTVDDMIDLVSQGQQLHVWSMIRQVMKPEDAKFVGEQPLDLKIIEESKVLVEAFQRVNPHMQEGATESFLQTKASNDSGLTK